jgi:hypothetical protein
MKKLILGISILISTTITAQISQGNWLAGGNASFSYAESKSGSTNPYKAFMIDLAPNVGYFIIDQLALGTKVNYRRNQSESNESNNTFESLNISPFARYYIFESERMFNPFLESSYRFGFFVSDNTKEFSIGGGLAIFVNQNVAYEITLNYVDTRLKNFENNTIQFQGLMLGLGIQIHL